MSWTNLVDLIRQVKNKLPMANGGVPAGGATGQVLTKASNADNDVDWETAGGGSGTVTHTGGALTAHRVVVGNGSDDVEVIAALGSAGQYLRSGGAGADPAMASIAESEVTNLVSDLAAKAPTSRNINTTAPIAGGGDLSADRTISIPKATASVDGYLDHADFATFNSKLSSPIAEGDVTGLVSDLAAKAPLASPALTGTPTAPTPAGGDNSTKIATTAFVASSAGSGALAPSRTSTVLITGSLADGANQTGAIALAKSALIVEVDGDRACWVRLYSSAAARDADTARLIEVDPTFGTQHGVMLDLYINGTVGLNYKLAPKVPLCDDDGGGTNLYYNVVNKSGSTSTVQVTFYFVPMEN